VLLFINEKVMPVRISLSAESGPIKVETKFQQVQFPAFFFPGGCTHCDQWIREWRNLFPETELNLYNIYKQNQFNLLSGLEKSRI